MRGRSPLPEGSFNVAQVSHGGTNGSEEDPLRVRGPHAPELQDEFVKQDTEAPERVVGLRVGEVQEERLAESGLSLPVFRLGRRRGGRLAGRRGGRRGRGPGGGVAQDSRLLC